MVTLVHLGSRFSEERTHKRRSATHLGISPSLFEDRPSIQMGYGRAAQSESKAFYGVRRTLFDFEIEQFGNAVSDRGRDQRSVRHAGLVTLVKISMVLERYRKSCCLSRAVIQS